MSKLIQTVAVREKAPVWLQTNHVRTEDTNGVDQNEDAGGLVLNITKLAGGARRGAADAHFDACFLAIPR